MRRLGLNRLRHLDPLVLTLLLRRSLLEEKQWNLLEEWAYVMPYGTVTVRNGLLPAFLRIL